MTRRCGPLALLLAALVACSGLAGEPPSLATLTPAPRAAADLLKGARVFAERCSSCHGPGGAGDGELALNGSIPAPGDFTRPAAARGQSPQQWLATIRDGRIEALMPPWRDSLSDAELRDVALYTYTLHYQPQQLVRGQRVIEEVCAAGCPGLEAFGDLRTPATLDQLSDAALRAALPASLAEEDAWAAVAWLRARDLRGPEQLGRPFAIREPLTGAIIGQINNGTQGAAVPPGLKVTLLEFGSGTMPALRETHSDADGRFRFDDLSLEPGRSYSVLVEHAGRRFPSARVNADAGRPQVNLPVTIFEAGADPSAITIAALVQQVSVVDEALQIVLVARFRNHSDRVYSGEREIAPGQFASLTLPLPAAAFDLTPPDDSGRFIIDDAGHTVTDTLPVYPNAEHLVQLAWRQPWDGEGAALELPLAQALEGEVRLLLQPGLTLSDSDLQPIGPQQVGAALYEGYGALLRLEPGASLRHTLAARAPSLPAGVVGAEALAPGSLLTLLTVLVLLHWRSRGSSDVRRLRALERQIARLDADHERGAINHDVYRRRRIALQRQLSGSDEGEDGRGA